MKINYDARTEARGELHGVQARHQIFTRIVLLPTEAQELSVCEPQQCELKVSALSAFPACCPMGAAPLSSGMIQPAGKQLIVF